MAELKVRGAYGAAIGHANREAVRAYFVTHVGCTNKECAEALGLNVMSISKHVKALRQEWAENANRQPEG